MPDEGHLLGDFLWAPGEPIKEGHVVIDNLADLGGAPGPALGPAGGVLSGTYPSPGFAVPMATSADLVAHTADTTAVHGISDTANLIYASDLAAHAADTTAVHGIADTATLVLTSDSRLSDQRVPTDGSVTNAKVAAGAAIAYSKLNLAGAVLLTDLAFDLATQPELDAHSADTTNVHGIADTAALALSSDMALKVSKAGDTMTGLLTLAAGAKVTFDGSNFEWNANGASAWLWNYQNTPLRFATNGIERLTIAGDGGVSVAQLLTASLGLALPAGQSIAWAGDTSLGRLSAGVLGLGGVAIVVTTDVRLSDSRPPMGAAGGVLSGTFPSPGFAVDMATQAELDAVAAAKQATITAGEGLLKTGVTLDVLVDGSTIEISADTLRVKALGITDAHVASANKDGAAGVVSLRTIGLGALQAMAGDTRLDTIAAPTGNVSLNSKKLTSVLDPTAAQDAATKAYVDAVAAGLAWKDSVQVATTANIDLASAPATIDGVSPTLGGRVLVKNQTTASQNGIYFYEGSAAPMPRTDDADSAAELKSAAVFVEEGDTLANTGWVQTVDNITVDVSSIIWTQFTGAAALIAGAGLAQTGNTLDVVVENSTLEINADTLRVKDGGITLAKLSFDPATQAELDAHIAAADPHAGYALESLIDAKGDLYVGTANNTLARLGVGTNGQGLVAASGETTGLQWVDIATQAELDAHTAAAAPHSGHALLAHVHAAADVTSGVLATARLGSGTANSGTFLRGDSTWDAVSIADLDFDPATQAELDAGLALKVAKAGDTMTGLLTAASGVKSTFDGSNFDLNSNASSAWLWNNQNTPLRFATNNIERLTIAAAGSITVALSLTVGQTLVLPGSSASSSKLATTVTGDTQPERFLITADGKHYWGDGTAALNTNLYCSAADTLKTDDAFIAATLQSLGTISSGGSITQGGVVVVLTNDARLSDSRAPTGAAGGVLSGTYPNPGFVVDMATQAELDAHTSAVAPHSGHALLVHAHAAADITSGVLATARLGSGTANSGTFLRGDSTWDAVSVADLDFDPATQTELDAGLALKVAKAGDTMTGNLGIGNAPDAKLHVSAFTNTTVAAAIIHGDEYGLAVGTASTSSTRYAFIVQGGTNWQLSGGSALFYVRADGRVGVGTSTPDSRLNVVGGGLVLSGTAYYNATMSQDQSNFCGVGFGYDTAGQLGVIFANTEGAGSSLAFWTHNGATWAEKMRLTAAGRLELPLAGSVGGLLIGGNTSLYSSASDVLKTDDSFHVALSFRHLGTTLGLYGVAAVTQRAAIAAPTGGTVQDSETRTAVNLIRQALIDVGVTAA